MSEHKTVYGILCLLWQKKTTSEIDFKQEVIFDTLLRNKNRELLNSMIT